MINDYLIYITLAVTIVAIPGPAVILTIKNSIKYGFKITIAGILGNFVAMVIVATISALGLGAIILASSTIFTITKIIGCFYLIYLGIKAWNTPIQKNALLHKPEYRKKTEFFSVFKEGVSVGMSNPKAIAFFTALFPQFIDPTRSFAPQFFTLILTIEAVSFLILTCYASLSLKAVPLLSKNNSMRFFHKLTGGAFIGFGVCLLYGK